jgi:hypothetical protein
MMVRRSNSNTAVKFFFSCLVAALLALAGCTSDTIPSDPSMRAAQLESAQKGVDQSAISKSGRRSGPPIITKSVKSLIKKDAQ